MSPLKYLTTIQMNEIIKYEASMNYEEECNQFTGNPRKHPYDKSRIILIDRRALLLLIYNYMFLNNARVFYFYYLRNLKRLRERMIRLIII